VTGGALALLWLSDNYMIDDLLEPYAHQSALDFPDFITCGRAGGSHNLCQVLGNACNLL
jgi:hypothetical protein